MRDIIPVYRETNKNQNDIVCVSKYLLKFYLLIAFLITEKSLSKTTLTTN